MASLHAFFKLPSARQTVTSLDPLVTVQQAQYIIILSARACDNFLAKTGVRKNKD